MDENGHVNFGSRPPADASESQKIELKNELDSVQVKISKNYAYCGDRPLPGPVNDPVGVLSGIKKQMPKWKEKLRETETGLAELTHRKLERQKKGLRGYDNSRWNERSRGLKRQADEYRCMIDWGSEQINRLAGTRQTILNAVDKLGADIAAEELARDKACGPQSLVPQKQERFLEWYDCAAPFEDEIRRLERELRYARRKARKIE